MSKNNDSASFASFTTIVLGPHITCSGRVERGMFDNVLYDYCTKCGAFGNEATVPVEKVDVAAESVTEILTEVPKVVTIPEAEKVIKVDQKQLIKDLRAMTQAGMQDCKTALEEAAWDLDKAADIVKARGLANTSRNASKVASEGRAVVHQDSLSKATMVEVNCQTDFVAGSENFVNFCNVVSETMGKTDLTEFKGDCSIIPVSETASLEDARKEVMASTKENIVVRRWFTNEVSGDNRRVFSYLHSNNKLGVLVAMEAPSKEAVTSPEFEEFSNNIAMQIAAMNPIEVSVDKIPQTDKDRQKLIFETQLRDAKKDEKQWPKIIEGKFRKWNTEVALVEQESVITAKTSIKVLADQLSTKLCNEAGKVKILNFTRCQVGEGVEKVQEDYSAEISKLSGVKTEVVEIKESTL